MQLKFRNTFLFFPLLAAAMLLGACANPSNRSAGIEEDGRPASFASDDEFLDFIQKTHLNYMWEGAEPTSGLAPERIHMDGIYPENDADVVTTGGSGFGLAGLVVGIDRGFIPREEGVARLHRIADYLAAADRFHGVWP